MFSGFKIQKCISLAPIFDRNTNLNKPWLPGVEYVFALPWPGYGVFDHEFIMFIGSFLMKLLVLVACSLVDHRCVLIKT